MKKLILIIVLFTAFGFSSFTQEATKGIHSLGLDAQLYPAGLIINMKADWRLTEKGLLVTKLGYNLAERQDFGEHDQENGGGPGLAIGYKRYFKEGYKGFFADARFATWFLKIDWRNDSPASNGTTHITVLQPTIAIGYDFVLKGDKVKLGLMAAAGYELNMITSGQEVGQGGISLFGASLSFRLD